MGKQVDFGGNWRGFYEQGGRRHGISMVVAQRGQSVVGRMRDDDTLLTTAHPQQVIVEAPDGEHDEAPPQRERLAQLETIAALPEYSSIEGDADGDRLVFEKRYLGPHQVTSWIDGHAEAHYTLHDHRVRYEGCLDPRGELLVGRWLLGPSDAPQMSGTFELRRQQDDGPAHH
ncbi:MAG: hypothetical protein R3F29_06795 [Planctomycetota bacterium]